MCSASACEHCWSVEQFIRSKRKNRLSQELVETLIRRSFALTNLVLRKSLDAARDHLFMWDIELVMTSPNRNPKFKCGFFNGYFTDLICLESRLMYPPITCTQHLFLVISHSLLCEID